MTYLIDTNIISEIRKKAGCDRNVAAWYEAIEEDDLYLSVMVTGEIRKGAELLRRRNPAKAALLDDWLRQIGTAFGERILPIDRAIADEWGKMAATRTVPVVDGLLAATARVRGMILVTRNDADVAGLGAAVLNPFRAAPGPP